jgi:hypothetical protein
MPDLLHCAVQQVWLMTQVWHMAGYMPDLLRSAAGH